MFDRALESNQWPFCERGKAKPAPRPGQGVFCAAQDGKSPHPDGAKVHVISRQGNQQPFEPGHNPSGF
jgi:hypothetical protein